MKLPDSHPLKIELAELKAMQEKRKAYWAGLANDLGEEWHFSSSVDRTMFEEETKKGEQRRDELISMIARAEMGASMEELGIKDDRAGVSSIPVQQIPYDRPLSQSLRGQSTPDRGMNRGAAHGGNRGGLRGSSRGGNRGSQQGGARGGPRGGIWGGGNHRVRGNRGRGFQIRVPRGFAGNRNNQQPDNRNPAAVEQWYRDVGIQRENEVEQNIMIKSSPSIVSAQHSSLKDAPLVEKDGYHFRATPALQSQPAQHAAPAASSEIVPIQDTREEDDVFEDAVERQDDEFVDIGAVPSPVEEVDLTMEDSPPPTRIGDADWDDL